MAKKKEHWIKRLAIWIGTTIITPVIVSLIVDFFKGIPKLSTIWAILKWCANVVCSFLNLEIKVWWLLVSIILIFIVLYLILRIITAFESEYPNYTEEVFRGLKWTWRWQKNYKNEWMVVGIKPHCPDCNTPMIEINDWGPRFACIRCDFKSGLEQYEDSRNIEFLVYDRADKMEAENKKN